MRATLFLSPAVKLFSVRSRQAGPFPALCISLSFIAFFCTHKKLNEEGTRERGRNNIARKQSRNKFLAVKAPSEEDEEDEEKGWR